MNIEQIIGGTIVIVLVLVWGALMFKWALIARESVKNMHQ
jgi:hypothetical protein